MSTQRSLGWEPVLLGEDGGPEMSRVAAMITALTAEFGADYATRFTRAVEAAYHDDQPRYLAEIAGAQDILVDARWPREQSRKIVTAHMRSVHAAVGDDVQAHVNNGGTLPPRRPPVLTVDGSTAVPETPATPAAAPRRRALPDSSRLLEVFARPETAVTRFELAAGAFAPLWGTRLSETDLPTVLDADRLGQFVCATDGSASCARVIDDEVCWQLGNRPDSVELIEDSPRVVTVGEVVGRMALLSAAHRRWPDIDLVRALLEALCSRHDVLVGAVLDGRCRAPRRRSAGEPPLDLSARIAVLGSLLQRGERVEFRQRLPGGSDGASGLLAAVALHRLPRPSADAEPFSRVDTGTPGGDGPLVAAPNPPVVAAGQSILSELAEGTES
ncbi:hypothetical protein ACWEKT_20960 [Nocardia takedensis]